MNNHSGDEFSEFSQKLGLVLTELGATAKQAADGKPDSGNQPREVVLQQNKFTLFHYLSENTKKSKGIPVLIVYALVNRPDILDLQEKHSAIAKLIESGQDVYLLDWGYPDKNDKNLGLNDYINNQLHGCVEAVCKRHFLESINLLGICQGGTLSLCYSCLHPEKVNKLVLMVTPVDFHTDHDLLSQWVKYVDIDRLVDILGNIPGGLLSNTFLTLKPYQLWLKKYLDLIDSIDKFEDRSDRVTNFITMEQWIFDGPDQAGEAFRHYVKSCYQGNQLIKGELEIGGKAVNLKKLSMPILNIYAKQDHIVPPAASKALGKLVSNKIYQEMQVTGGHIGIFVRPKSIAKVFPAIHEWLSLK